MDYLRLNLGCGSRLFADYINVDKFGNPDVTHDLETFPWPWKDDSVHEVLLNHVLEHLGRTPEVYLGVIRELYRICVDGGMIRITVPHHRHDHFFDDPTHVRTITAMGLSLFSQRLNRRWREQGFANSPLGLSIGVDFELIDTKYQPSELWYKLHPGAEIDQDNLLLEATLHNNLIQEVRMVLRAIKPPGSAANFHAPSDTINTVRTPADLAETRPKRARPPQTGGGDTNRRILFASHACYLDDSNGAATASRAMMQALARRGFATEVLCGAMLDMRSNADPEAWLEERGYEAAEHGGVHSLTDGPGSGHGGCRHFRLAVKGVPITIHRSPTTNPHHPDAVEQAGFLRLLDTTMDRFLPDVVVGYGGSRLASETFARARSRGISTVFMLHNFSYFNKIAFLDVDSVVVPSNFSAAHYAQTLGLRCDVIPNIVDFERVRLSDPKPNFVTFVNPSYEKGVYAFARIADELGRVRPEIPILVVEGRGDESTLVGCGLDLRVHGTIHLIDHPRDPRNFWNLTRICLMPSLWPESQGLVAIEAMLNGIPVVASDRGALPETLGRSGITLPLPSRLTPSTREIPTAGEVRSWVDSIIRLWDDADYYSKQSSLAVGESARWEPEPLETRYAQFFGQVGRVARPRA